MMIAHAIVIVPSLYPYYLLIMIKDTPAMLLIAPDDILIHLLIVIKGYSLYILWYWLDPQQHG